MQKQALSPDRLTECIFELNAKVDYLTTLLSNSGPVADEIGGIELAEKITRLSAARLYTLVSQRAIPHAKKGNRLTFRRSQLLLWIEEGNRQQKGGMPRVSQPVQFLTTSTKRTAPAKSPVLVSDCAREIRAVGAEIWHFQKLDYGFLMRCTVAGKQVRVVVPALVPTTEPIADEANSRLHIVFDVDRLREWLLTIAQRL